VRARRAREGKKRRIGKGKEHFGRGSGNVLIVSTRASPMPGEPRRESFSSPPPIFIRPRSFS